MSLYGLTWEWYAFILSLYIFCSHFGAALCARRVTITSSYLKEVQVQTLSADFSGRMANTMMGMKTLYD